jgi:SAM-dependent methyltransferase
VTFATGIEAYARHVGRYTPALASAFCDAVGIAAGDAALDVGCGSGALLGELASRVGASAVAGVDPSEPFVAACQNALPGVDVQVGSAESLPFADSSFDVVLAQLVVNFMWDAVAGVSEMRRVARRTVAACVWDYAGEMTMLRAFWDAALEIDPDAPDEGRVMRFCTLPELEELWERIGLRDVETGALVVAADYADFDDYWNPFTAGLAPSGAYCASLDDDRRAELREACFRRLGAPSGPFRLTAKAWYVSGRR